MDRRRFLAAIATSGAMILAGCGGEGSDRAETTGGDAATVTATTSSSASATSTPSETSTSTTESTESTTETETNTETATDAETETETESETDTATETETETESGSSPSSLPGASEAIEATVTRVVDGDTMEVTLADGTEDTIRLLGVDTPETYSENTPDEYGFPDTVAARDWLANWGDRATSFATDRLDGTDVIIGIDEESDRRGSFGRLLCYLYYDGEANFNRQLLNRGLARVYPSTFTLRSEFETVEKTARENEVGLWGFEGGSGAMETATEAETETEVPDSGSGDSGNDGSDLPPPSGGSDPYDCSDFDSQAQAQQVLDNTPGDPSGLDADDDGVACESLD